jgi:hypothetical protein
MVEVIAAIYPIQIRKQAELKEIEYTVALPGLHELVKILVGKAEAHAEVEKNASSLIFKEDFVAADLVDSSVERERSHQCNQRLVKKKSVSLLIAILKVVARSHINT